MSPGEFHSAVYNTAIALGANDVQARLAAAQASEETGFGKSMVGNNAFGIKAGSTYTGPSVTASTEEEYNGNTVRENANFRAYDNFTDSVKDYLSTMQENFPDSWNATNFPDAVAGLKTGVYGAYATRAAYPKSMLSIDNKYGSLSFAQNPDNVPAPYGPNDPAPDYAVPDDVLPMSEPNFVPMSGEFAYAARPTNVPVPEARPEDVATPGLLTSYQPTEQASAATPFDAVTPGQWGLNKNVAPALIPTVETWSDMAAAAPISAPVTAPMGNVTAQGFLGANPALAANATANPMLNVPAQAELASIPGLEASATAGMLATPSERMGIAEPGFDMSRFDGAAPAVAPDFDMGRFAAPETAAFDQSRFGPPSIDVATNTQSFGEQPAMAANLGNFPAGLLAQREVVQAPQAASIDTGAFDPSRFGQVPTAEFDQSRFGPSLVDPATNVASFTDQPADIGGFLDAMAAQRGPATGVNSAEFQTQVANTMRQQFNPSIQAPTAQPVSEVATGGFLTAPASVTTNSLAKNTPAYQAFTPAPGVFSAYDAPRMMAAVEDQAANDLARSVETPMFNQTSVNSIPGLANEKNPYGLDPMVALNAQPSNIGEVLAGSVPPQVSLPSLAQPAVDNTITGSTTPGLLSPTSITASTPTLTGGGSLTSGLNRGLLADQPINQVGFLSDLSPNIDINLSGNIVPATQAEIAAPALETVDVAEQPTVAAQNETVEGPATTPAVEQQQQTQPTTATRTTPAVKTTPSISSRLASVVNPGTAIGAAIGGGLLGVPGAAIGGFLGNAVNQGGFLSSDPVSVNNIGSGSDAVYSVWGGAQPIGTQATASDGQQVTSMGNGYTAITGKSGAITVFDNNGKAMAYHGTALGNDEDAEAEATTSGGGFFGGLFG